MDREHSGFWNWVGSHENNVMIVVIGGLIWASAIVAVLP